MEDVVGNFDFSQFLSKPEEGSTKENEVKDGVEETQKEEKEDKHVTEADLLGIFGSPTTASGDVKNKEELEAPSSSGVSSSSKNDQFFSSIANALAEEGVFQDLSADDIKKIKTADDFKDAMKKQMSAGLSASQRRVSEALDNNINRGVVSQLEGNLKYLDSLKESDIKNEDNGNVRKELIYYDLLDKGFSQERAAKELKRSFDRGSDVEDAMEAYKSLYQSTQNRYNKLIEEAKANNERMAAEEKEAAKKFEENFLDEKGFGFEGITIDKATRKAAYDIAIKRRIKDEREGDMVSEMEMNRRKDPQGFGAKIALLYALTDGFKTLEKINALKVNKEIKKGLQNLEDKLNTTARDDGGRLSFVGGVESDKESYSGLVQPDFF